MGIKRQVILECDRCGLKIDHEGEDVEYAGIREVKFSISGGLGEALLWNGYLCGPCGKKMRDRIMSVLRESDDSLPVKDSACS